MKDDCLTNGHLAFEYGDAEHAKRLWRVTYFDKRLPGREVRCTNWFASEHEANVFENRVRENPDREFISFSVWLLSPTKSEAEQAVIFSRSECPFNYCDQPAPYEACQAYCRHAHSQDNRK